MALTLAERVAAGRKARQLVKRADQARIGRIDRDPIPLLKRSSVGRVGRLIPLRYGRMLESPLAFFRGSAGLQAHDLADTPNSGFYFQICGDCHLSNFGGFATPERNLLFDLNDFDETHPGPWEWDLKRLIASFVVAGRYLHHGEGVAEEAAFRAAQSYQQNMAQYATMGALEIWYDKITFERLLEMADTPKIRRILKNGICKAMARTHDHLLPQLGERIDGRWIIRDRPPALFHIYGNATLFDETDDWIKLGDWQALVKSMYREYQGNLDANRRQLLDQFSMQDLAFKVVGVGSVGTRCLMLLLVDARDKPLFLQIKEAKQSVLEPYVSVKATYKHQGRRVVEGQRLMQAASDQFVAWSTGPSGRHFYFRQLRDMKLSPEVELYDNDLLCAYAQLCGRVLARAHARSGGMAVEIASYLGSNDSVATALVKYARAYANQVDKDFDSFSKACRSGKLQARTEVDFARDFSV